MNRSILSVVLSILRHWSHVRSAFESPRFQKYTLAQEEPWSRLGGYAAARSSSSPLFVRHSWKLFKQWFRSGNTSSATSASQPSCIKLKRCCIYWAWMRHQASTPCLKLKHGHFGRLISALVFRTGILERCFIKRDISTIPPLFKSWSKFRFFGTCTDNIRAFHPY